jgi:glycosyltransferase XagB
MPKTRRTGKALLKSLIDDGAVSEGDSEALAYWMKYYPDTWIEKWANISYSSDSKFYKCISRHLGMDYLPYSMLKKGRKLIRYFPEHYLQKNRIVPVKATDEKMVFAISNPFDKIKRKKVVEELGGGKDVEFVISDPDNISKAISKEYEKIDSLKSVSELWYMDPGDSAHNILTTAQKIFLLLMFAFMISWFFMDYPSSFIFAFAAVNLAYFLLSPSKILSLFYVSMWGVGNSLSVSDNELKKIKRCELPVYTVLVPLYREADMLKNVLDSVYALDYPPEKKDIKILLEEGDEETIGEAMRMGLFSSSGRYRGIDVVIVPKSDIKTKPRACNFGLHESRGEYLVIYDAEDTPERDQLLKAVAGFERAGGDTVCLQAMLNFFNDRENILTKWFSVEYMAWFDYYLPALEKIGAPIPLGGTSNHFRVESLKNACSWDPYNVTEDADLGLRIYRMGWKTKVIDSHTYEEANSRLWNWIRQRSRWEKGYIQTYLVHMRAPWRLIRRMGLRKFILFQASFGSNTLLPLINPLLWAVTAAYLVFGRDALGFLTPWPLDLICAINLIAGNILYILFHIGAAIKSGKRHLILPSFVIPLYWGLISFAAWKGMIQLITRPFYWEKTRHGITKVKKWQMTKS